MRIRAFDTITLLLLSAGVIFILLYLYLLNIEHDIEDHNSHHRSITKMKVLDMEFNDFLVHRLTSANYDAISTKVDTFAETIKTLRQRIMLKGDEEQLGDDVALIERLFEQKRDNIERFKSTNASAINSLNYLFDLDKAIMDDKSLPSSATSVTNGLLFSLLQKFTQMDIDDAMMQRSLIDLKALIGEENQSDLYFFYRHSRLVQEELDRLQAQSDSHDNILLYEAIDAFHDKIDNIYDKNLLKQKIITSSIFVLAFFIWIPLIFMYRISLRSKKELQAFKFAVEHSDNSIVMTSPDRKIVYVNEVFERDTGYSKEEIMGQNPRILRSYIQDQSFFDQMNAVLDKGQKWEGEFVNKRKDGSIFYEKASIVPIFLNDRLINFLAIKLDITEYIEQRQQLERSAAVFDQTEDAITITDKDNHIISINKAFEKMTGYSEADVIGLTPKVLQSGQHNTHFYQKMWESLLRDDVWKGKIYDKTKSGDIIPIWLTIKALRDKEGQINSFISIHTDLQNIIKTQERADFLAYHDSLTGLPNRIQFEEHLTHALTLATRNQTNLAVLFIDLDRFKVINDTLGHQVGDELLKTVAQRIKQVLRETDMLARIGGDEFVIILENFDQESGPAYVSTKVLDAVKRPIKTGSNLLNTTASIGIALYPDDGLDGNTIIKHADSAMYHAKDLGKNNYQYYTERLSHAVHLRLDIEQALQSALRDEEFSLFYQPQYDLNEHRIIGVEALLRWESKTIGQVSPAEFIPIAEDNGMIIEIGEFVFETACKAFKTFQRYEPDLKTIAINVSSIQFREPDLLKKFLDIATKTGVAPQNIEIEITERYIMEYTTTNMTILEDLRELGFKISIDDFGTGYSSMSYLKRLPLDTIKIDKSFIDDIPEDNNDVEIAKAIIVLSKSLGYDVVAEGIEKATQEEFLLAHRCDIGQGYHFSRPLCEHDLIQFCQERHKHTTT